MKRAIAAVVLAAASASAAHAEPVTVVARAESVDVLASTGGGLHRLIYVAPTDHPELITLVTGTRAAATVELSLTPFAGRESKLVALQLTSTVVDTRLASKQTTEFLLRATTGGALEVVCTLPVAASTSPLAGGSGWHRDVTIALDANPRGGGTHFTVTSRDYSDAVEYQPTVVRYELGADGGCSLVP